MHFGIFTDINVYHDTFQVVDYAMTDIQKNSESKILQIVSDGGIWKN